MSKNTLLNYFTRTPVVDKENSNAPSRANEKAVTPQTPKSKSRTAKEESTPKQNGNLKTPTSQKKRSRNVSLDKFSSPASSKKPKTEIKTEEVESPEQNESPPLKRRKRILMELQSDEEDSGDEYVPENKESESEESEDEPSLSPSEDEASCSDGSESNEPTPKKTGRSKGKKLTAVSLNSSFAAEKSKSSLAVPSKESVSDDSWPHLKLPFLQPDKIRDAKRRLKTDPNYDPKTLYVPEDFKEKLTPGLRQWWEMKSQNFDIVLFFKVGKFYELYHMDAVTAANELNLTFMRGEHAHVGFPEIAYGRFSSTLIEKGYKVARVEQTETPDMMAERCKKLSKPTKFDRVVKREVCQITSRGTRVFGVLDGETKEAESNFLLAVAEQEIDSTSSQYGVCFVDTSIGVFHIGQFTDDRHASRLRTLVAHYPPVQILYERNQITARTRQLFDTVLSAASKDSLLPDTEFWSASNTLIKLAENYFTGREFPEQLTRFTGEEASVNTTVNSERELGVRSLGAIVWYLQRCLIDYQLLTMGQFSIYEPVDMVGSIVRNSAATADTGSRYVVLDAITLKNLNVLENSSGGTTGTLLHKLDNCCTPFGKRLLQRWICNPLRNIDSIKRRQEAVQYLLDCSIIRDVRTHMSQLPDLERLLARIHSQGTCGIKDNHPDTRAFLFEEKTYSKRKIVDFISALNGFKTAQTIIQFFEDLDEEGIPLLLRQCCFKASNKAGSFPNLSDHLNFFEKAFDHNEAQKEGRILPSEGTDADYDEAIANLKSIEKEAKSYLKDQCEHFGCQVKYFGNDRKRYQLEVPESAIRRANSKYELIGQRKGFKRYSTLETKDILERMMAAEERKTNVLKNLRERIFAKFSENWLHPSATSAVPSRIDRRWALGILPAERYVDWSAAVQCLSVLDVLIAFSEYNRNENQTCVPEFVPISPTEQPFVSLIDGVYPCATGDDVFIPNRTIIGYDDDGVSQPSLVLVTGPNMGGKSTLMRQLGLIVIMAHMGCHVPAVGLKLSLVDRIFTRIGANDDIMAGESTFYVELCETNSILQHSTAHSLVLVDELGRGTSTYDGTAIASAVLKELGRIKCRTLFSTHYHSLVEDFRNDENVALGHMACMVENENEDDVNESEETVTFLYKFAKGACPKSYGFNAARLAGMPSHITRVGQQRAKQLELDAGKRNRFKTLFKRELEAVRELIAVL